MSQRERTLACWGWVDNNISMQKCSQCLLPFSLSKLPRKLPSCEHSICEPCLREITDLRQEVILCGFCASSVLKQDIRIFPLNTALLISLTAAPPPPCPPPVPAQEDDNQLLQELPHGGSEQCRWHKVPSDVICISCKLRICPHCALFGNHKDHRFKRLEDFEKEVAEKCRIFTEIEAEHAKAAAQQFQLPQQLHSALMQRRNQLANELKQQVQVLLDSIRMQEEAALKEIDSLLGEVEKSFACCPSLGQFQQVQTRFQKWERSCRQSMQCLKNKGSVEEKLYYYYEGPLEIVTEGYIFIEEMKKYREEVMSSIAEKMQDVKLMPPMVKTTGLIRVSKANCSWTPEKDHQNEEANPFLDCTSSEIMLGSSTSVLNTSSLEADLNISKSSSRIQPKRIVKKTPPELEIKSLKSIEKDKGRNITNTVIVKKQIVTSPRPATHKSRASDISSLRSSPRLFKSPTSKESETEAAEVGAFEVKEPEKIYLQFSKNTLSDFFDISECHLSSDKVVEYVHRARRIHKIKGLKLCNNRLTVTGFQKMTEFLQGVANINLANNLVNQTVFDVIVKYRERLESLRVLNLAHNPITLDKKANMRLDEVKKMGVIVTF